MQFNISGKISTEIYATVYRGDGSVKEVIGPTSNLITESGFEFLSGKASWSSVLRMDVFGQALRIGVGDTEPSTSDTSLENMKFNDSAGEFESTDSYNEQSGGDDDPIVESYIYKFLLKKGALDSSTDGDYKEFGLAHSENTDDPLHTRALFRDSDGNATGVTVQSDEQLELIYRIDATLSPVGVESGSFDITNVGTVNFKHKITGAVYSHEDAQFFMWAGDHEIAKFGLARVDAANFVWPDYSTEDPFNIGNKDVGTVHEAGNLGYVNDYAENKHPSTGVFEWEFTIPASEANFDINAFAVGSKNRYTDPWDESTNEVDDPVYVLVLDDGESIPKTSDHELTLTFRIEWSQ